MENGQDYRSCGCFLPNHHSSVNKYCIYLDQIFNSFIFISRNLVLVYKLHVNWKPFYVSAVNHRPQVDSSCK